MKTVSWILLAIAAVLIILGSLGSVTIAYFGAPSSDIITGSVSLQDLEISPEAATALRGRRATAAAFGLSLGILLLFVILGPYRQGAAWAWWAMLLAVILLSGTILLRIPMLGTFQGTGTAGLILLVVIPALLLHLAGNKLDEAREPEPPPT
jgi:hypothetical protein